MDIQDLKDPHGGNLLKTADKRLAYLDFGLVSVIPPGVMDALICATVYVMNRDYVALAKGFPALALMSESDLLEDFEPFAAALEAALDPIVADFRRQMGLDGGFGSNEAPSGSERVAFAQLIDRVFLLARSFNFRVPPYFISNVRALGELEGLAMTADPGFNLISVVYPYVCRRLLTDPSPPLRAALKDLIVADDGSVQWDVLEVLMSDSNFLDQRVGAGGETSSLLRLVRCEKHGKQGKQSLSTTASFGPTDRHLRHCSKGYTRSVSRAAFAETRRRNIDGLKRQRC
ncbi:conserved unknown protein [Ectocarpus siliculosus]|uniref:ABC1 atypical kinase-like domain-containing protein n=1 Tax=Ectocarpus siliculosus TaxID=2880 RepID=D7FNM7_ECTSI|nr:conserved unknown protein [Ectocarpus siliculosus]|eukprot:CBJ26038.1 conserved unknown protein [Ectocarpus siliculosus]